MSLNNRTTSPKELLGHRIGDLRNLCKKRVYKFLNAIRPNPKEKKCPEGTMPCSENTSLDETICVGEEQRKSQCPITFV